MSNDAKFILGTVIAAIVATGIVVAVVVGTVLGSQIVHNGMQVRELAKGIAEHRDHFHAGVRTEIQALRSQLAAGVGPDLVDEVRRDHRRLYDRMHNLEQELSEVGQSVRGLRHDTSTTRTLKERLMDIQNELEKVNRNLQNPNPAPAAATPSLDERMRDIRDELRDVNRNLQAAQQKPE